MKIWFNFNHLRFHSSNSVMIQRQISQCKHLLFHVTRHIESPYGIPNENQYELFNLVPF